MFQDLSMILGQLHIDPDWHVRRAVCDALPLLLRSFPKSQVDIMMELIDTDNSPLRDTKQSTPQRATGILAAAAVAHCPQLRVF